MKCKRITGSADFNLTETSDVCEKDRNGNPFCFKKIAADNLTALRGRAQNKNAPLKIREAFLIT